MTPQEKAAAYDKAIERTRRMIEDYKNRGLENYIAYAKENIDYIFPELKESEGENMKESLITFFRKYPYSIGDAGINPLDAIAWLEKQGEHANFLSEIQVGDKVTRNEDGVLVNLSQLNRIAKPVEKQGEQNPVIFIPKFRVGDKLVSTKNPRLTYEVLEVGHINELGNPEYKVEIFTDGKGSNPRNIHDMECHKVDEWAKLIEQKPTDKAEPKFKKE